MEVSNKNTDKTFHLDEVSKHVPLPNALRDITFNYTKEKRGYDFPNMPTAPECARISLFGAPYLNQKQSEHMTRLGKMVLSGEKNDVETVVDEVRKKPALLNIVITLEDPLRTPVTGTLLQIAAMAGDVNLMQNITNEADRGLVERLITAAGDHITSENVAAQLKCINSDDAINANNKRVQRYFDIIKKFGNRLCEDRITHEKAIAELDEELRVERSKAVSAGFIFDPRILDDTTQWFMENVNNFGTWCSSKSSIFVTNGFGKLQSLLSSRDAQVMRAGVGYLVDGNEMPQRTFFYDASSRLGHDFHLGYFGSEAYGLAAPGRLLVWKRYVEQKQQNLKTQSDKSLYRK